MRRLAGARGPQMQAGFAARALKLDFSGFKFATRQQAVAVPAANLRGRCDRRFHKEPSLCGARRVGRVCFMLLTMAMLEVHVHGQIHGPPDELLLGAEPGLFHQFFQARQGFLRAVRVKGADPARMAGVSELEHFQRGGVPHFADQNALGRISKATTSLPR